MPDGPAVTILYRNWRGEVSRRRILPRFIRYGATEWHPEPQYVLEAFDLDKGADRSFALADVLRWGAGGAVAALRAAADELWALADALDRPPAPP